MPKSNGEKLGRPPGGPAGFHKCPGGRWQGLGGAAWRAGVNAGDELLALNGDRIGGGLDSLLRRYAPGDEVELALFRDGALETLFLTLDPVSADHAIEIDENAGYRARELRRDWLGGFDVGNEDD